ncbi:OTU domain-containing protein [Legionella shakespearei]|uniref:Uncharacterized protein n=1 Tax=Legionella shakespearei DSM 23087 TaxID=1122169 RepID=A0A0W0Z4X4_9GAMM|nr:OTU domain-containing protein [Legionella shakespearei]KTD64200.1 hypothetical protein Lsha_0631 [Legionella shakespearei DSM 23087]
MVKAFFDRTPAIDDGKQDKTEYKFIHVGGDQFRALAVSLIDYLRNTRRVNDVSLKKILERFDSRYPQYVPRPLYFSSAERMGMLINGPRKSEVVECMADVLRQLAVDEIYAHPLNYREVFNDLPASTSRDYLRQATTPLSVDALRALSQMLGLNITLSFTEHGKELRKRVVHANNSMPGPKADLYLQVQGTNYLPGVKNESDFAYVGHLAVKAPKPVEQTTSETITALLELIASDNSELLRNYFRWRNNLLFKLHDPDDKLNTQDLILLYAVFLPSQRGIVNNPNEFFARLTEKEKEPVTASKLQPSNYVNELLANAFAGWISTGLVDPDELFECIETPSYASPAA